MTIFLSHLFTNSGIALSDVRLLRHKDNRSSKGRSPYELWRDDRPQFDAYQAIQTIEHGPKLNAPYWASFVGTRTDETLFAGLYEVRSRQVLDVDTPMLNKDGIDMAGTRHSYELLLCDALVEYVGRLVIDWGSGERAWIQRADKQDKAILELRKEFKEPDFPGFLNFIETLSGLKKLPQSWVATLTSARGVYLLTCPKTREQYVGSASGAYGFWSRWQEYARTGHGGNVALKSRDPSDYQVSVLEVAGSSATDLDILAMEVSWKNKLQSREMGLNRN